MGKYDNGFNDGYNSGFKQGQKNALFKGGGIIAAAFVAVYTVATAISTAGANKYKDKLENEVRNGGANSQ